MALHPTVRLPGLAMFRQMALDRNLSVEDLISVLTSLLRKRQIRAAKDCAEATAFLLRRLVESSNYTDANHLLSDIQIVSKRLIAAQPRQLVIGNMARRVLGLVREEVEQDRTSGTEKSSNDPAQLLEGQTALKETLSSSSPQEISLPRTSMFQLLSKQRSRRLSERDNKTRHTVSEKSAEILDNTQSICQEVVEGIQELLDELRQVDDQIANYALDHIHSNEVILTNSISQELNKFLTKAAGKRRFDVILAQSFLNGSSAAYEPVLGTTGKQANTSRPSKTLANAGVSTTIIPDSAIFGVLPRVSKVILTADIVHADGSCLCSSSAKMMAMAAHFHRIPVLVLAGVFKISSRFPFNNERLLSNGSVGAHLLSHAEHLDEEQVEAQNPLDDAISADLVDLYVSNLGAHSPVSLNRIISDHYRTEDLHL